MSHHSMTGLIGLLMIFAVSSCGGKGDAPTSKDLPLQLQNLPPGWTIRESAIHPSRKLGAQTVRLTNSVLVFDGQELTVNIAECKSEEDASAVHELILKAQEQVAERSPRDGNVVAELISKNRRLIERAYQDLGFKSPKVVYEVSFQAAPIEKCDAMLWNRMFNECLVAKRDEAKIRDLAKGFTFGEQIRLRTGGLGGTKSDFSFNPKPRDTRTENDGDVTMFSFADLPQKHGMPTLDVSATVTAEAFALTPTKRKAGKELLGPTEFWPSDDPTVVALAKRITEGKVGPHEKTAAILEWLVPGKNLKYSGLPGSRYGVKKVLEQGFGRCWDFSDCFVTLSRAAGVPSRQVLGWLYKVEGHVWAEVLIEGEGWRQVDPTAGMGCDSRYISYIASESGQVPLVYVSGVRIEPKR